MIQSLEVRDFLREEIHGQEKRILQKQLCIRLGYSRARVSLALTQGKFSEGLLRRFAFVFPSLKHNETYQDLLRPSK